MKVDSFVYWLNISKKINENLVFYNCIPKRFKDKTSLFVKLKTQEVSKYSYKVEVKIRTSTIQSDQSYTTLLKLARSTAKDEYATDWI